MTRRPPLVVTDHALIRYMERVMGLDLDGIRASITSVAAGAHAIGAKCVSAKGVTYHFADNRVTTIDASHSPIASIRKGNAHSAGTRDSVRSHQPPSGQINARRPKPDRTDPNWRSEVET